MNHGKRRRRRTISLNTRNVPADVHSQFKAYCARRGYTMQEAVIALIKKAAKDNVALPEARRYHG